MRLIFSKLSNIWQLMHEKVCASMKIGAILELYSFGDRNDSWFAWPSYYKRACSGTDRHHIEKGLAQFGHFRVPDSLCSEYICASSPLEISLGWGTLPLWEDILKQSLCRTQIYLTIGSTLANVSADGMNQHWFAIVEPGFVYIVVSAIWEAERKNLAYIWWM